MFNLISCQLCIFTLLEELFLFFMKLTDIWYSFYIRLAVQYLRSRYFKTSFNLVVYAHLQGSVRLLARRYDQSNLYSE